MRDGDCVMCSNRAWRCAVVILTGHTQFAQAGYCKECKVNVEPNSSMEEHQRSRKHINKLLQLGLEVPISCMNETEKDKLPEGADIWLINFVYDLVLCHWDPLFNAVVKVDQPTGNVLLSQPEWINIKCVLLWCILGWR